MKHNLSEDSRAYTLKHTVKGNQKGDMVPLSVNLGGQECEGRMTNSLCFDNTPHNFTKQVATHSQGQTSMP